MAKQMELHQNPLLATIETADDLGVELAQAAMLLEEDSDLRDPADPDSWQNPAQHGNFRGWRQYRKMLSNEHIARFTPPA